MDSIGDLSPGFETAALDSPSLSQTDASLAPVSMDERKAIEPTLWSSMVKDFGRAFKNLARTAKSVSEVRSLKTHCKFYRARV